MNQCLFNRLNTRDSEQKDTEELLFFEGLSRCLHVPLYRGHRLWAVVMFVVSAVRCFCGIPHLSLIDYVNCDGY